MSCSAAKRLDLLGYGESWIHRRDSRAKLLAALVFLFCIASFPKYEVSALIPFSLVLVIWGAIGEVPLRLILRIMLVIAPFALLLGAFNPILDNHPALTIGSFSISGGWLSFSSILLRFALSAGIALILVATTSMPRIFNALLLMKIPRVFVLQLDFLYRYLFVLIDEGGGLNNARNLRDPEHKLPSLGIASKLFSVLLFRSLERARRVYLCMQARGFKGEVPIIRKEHFCFLDLCFLLSVVSFCLAARTLPLSNWIGFAVQKMVGL